MRLPTIYHYFSSIQWKFNKWIKILGDHSEKQPHFIRYVILSQRAPLWFIRNTALKGDQTPSSLLMTISKLKKDHRKIFELNILKLFYMHAQTILRSGTTYTWNLLAPVVIQLLKYSVIHLFSCKNCYHVN